MAKGSISWVMQGNILTPAGSWLLVHAAISIYLSFFVGGEGESCLRREDCCRLQFQASNKSGPICRQSCKSGEQSNLCPRGKHGCSLFIAITTPTFFLDRSRAQGQKVSPDVCMRLRISSAFPAWTRAIVLFPRSWGL